MSRYRLLVGFRLAEVILCSLLIVILTAWSVKSYRAYAINTKMLEPHSQLLGARLAIAIDSAYTGNFSSSVDYQHEPNIGVSQIDVSPEGHLTAEFSLSDTDVYSEGNLNNKTLVLFRNSYSQGGYQFDSWRCPNSPSPAPFSVTNPTTLGTIDPRYSHFICHGNFR